jgi:hypothetical protein
MFKLNIIVLQLDFLVRNLRAFKKFFKKSVTFSGNDLFRIIITHPPSSLPLSLSYLQPVPSKNTPLQINDNEKESSFTLFERVSSGRLPLEQRFPNF